MPGWRGLIRCSVLPGLEQTIERKAGPSIYPALHCRRAHDFAFFVTYALSYWLGPQVRLPKLSLLMAAHDCTEGVHDKRGPQGTMFISNLGPKLCCQRIGMATACLRGKSAMCETAITRKPRRVPS